MKTIAIIAPVNNEVEGIEIFDKSIRQELAKIIDYKFVVTYVDDGSNDGSNDILQKLAKKYKNTKLITLSKNFGKEIAVTAGISETNANALISLDSDGQHPVELIPEFIKQWQKGNDIVVGIREKSAKESFTKKTTSNLFYKIANNIFRIKLQPGITDYRLIDNEVRSEFMRFSEHNRITRGMIEWLGFNKSYITFSSKERLGGKRSYTYKKLITLASDSIVSMSTSPLKINFYIGSFTLIASILCGTLMVINYITNDPFNLNIRGSGYLLVFVTFLVSLIMLSQGLIGLYLSHIHTETQNRPLYIINRNKSLL